MTKFKSQKLSHDSRNEILHVAMGVKFKETQQNLKNTEIKLANDVYNLYYTKAQIVIMNQLPKKAFRKKPYISISYQRLNKKKKKYNASMISCFVNYDYCTDLRLSSDSKIKLPQFYNNDIDLQELSVSKKERGNLQKRFKKHHDDVIGFFKNKEVFRSTFRQVLASVKTTKQLTDIYPDAINYLNNCTDIPIADLVADLNKIK